MMNCFVMAWLTNDLDIGPIRLDSILSILCFLMWLILNLCYHLFNIETQQKNTCAHNSTHKAHANGIKKRKKTRYVSQKGMDPKFLRNQKFSKKYNGSKRVHDDE